MARVSRYFPQPGSTTRSLTILTHHHSGLDMPQFSEESCRKTKQNNNSASSFAGKAGQPAIFRDIYQGH